MAPQNENNDTGLLAAKLEALHEDVIEVKGALQELSEAITKLALVEERQSQTAASLERAFVALEKIETRVTAIERMQPDQRRTAKWMDRAVVAMVATLAAIFAKKVGLL